jgi:DNA invertase Pin-like site-specific DNA recombinase
MSYPMPEPEDDWALGVGYLRLSDLADPAAFDGRAELLHRAAAQRRVRLIEMIRENDLSPGAEPGKPKPASAFKRRKIRLPNGQVALRTVRPGFRRLLALLESGAATYAFAEDLDRLLRQPRDGEDLLDVVELSKATVISLSRSLTLTDGGTDDERDRARDMARHAERSSRDTARRVRAARARLAGLSFGGGLRPFGFDTDPSAPRYGKTVTPRDDEAAEIRAAAVALLRQKASLRGVTADWNGRGVLTVRGARWTTPTVRDTLMKPLNAGLVLEGFDPFEPNKVRKLIPATFLVGEPILDRGVWEELVALLTDPARRKHRGNAPRWLVSLFARCGVCGAECRVAEQWKYKCVAHACVTRRAGSSDNVSRAPRGVDDLVARMVVEQLCRVEAKGIELARPAPTLPEAEARRLRAERAALVKRRVTQAKMHAAGTLEDDAFAAGAKQIADDLAVIERRLEVAATADPLEEFRDGRPPAEVWLQLSMERRRAVTRVLIESVTINKAARPGARWFEREAVVVVPRFPY